MNKKIIFQQIISDFIEKELSQVIPREVEIPLDTNKIISIMGPRRSGKTYILFNLVNQLRKTVEHNRIVYVNFEDDRLFPLRLEDMDALVKGYYELFPKNKDQLVYFFFDEIQEIKNWEKFVRRINDQENCRIFLTGSSSQMLSREISTSLRGRTIPFEIFPLNFKEYLSFKQIEVNSNTSRGEAVMLHESMKFMQQGGFPELIFTKPQFHRKIIEEYLGLMIYKDLTERFSVKNTYLIKYLLKHFLVNLANPLTFTKVYHDLKSQGIKLAKNTVFEYASYLEEAYVIFLVKIYTSSIRKQAVNPTKVYGIDSAFKNALSISHDQGRIMENTVFLHLRGQGINPSYLLNEQEVDFYWEGGRMINVSLDISDIGTRQREINGLVSAMKRYGKKKAEIITYDKEEEVVINGKNIFIKPLWKFLMER